MKIKILFLTIFIIGTGATAIAQCDETAVQANKYLKDGFISDGQSYRALIYGDQLAEFNTTFYGGANYRIVAYVGSEKEQLQFSLKDREDNLLFSNEKHENSTFWDFEFEQTMQCTVEAKLDTTKQTSGCAVLLIGFEQ